MILFYSFHIHCYLMLCTMQSLRPCLGGGNGIEWKGMKIIILEYSSLPLFESFNGGNEKLIPLFWSLSVREWNGQEGTLIPLYSLKISNFHSSRNWEKWEGMKLDLMTFFTKTLKIPLYIQFFILKQGSNSNIVIK